VIQSAFRSRRAFLAAVKGLVLSSAPLPGWAGEVVPALAFCRDRPGPDQMLTPPEALAAAWLRGCADCKKLVVIVARQLVDEASRASDASDATTAPRPQRRPQTVDLCITCSDDSEEHLFLRVDGRIVDQAQAAGMSPRVVGAFLAERAWPP
jgi:hypothetical protein